MPQERPVLGVQSTPLNPSSDTFIDAYVPHLGRSQNTMPRIDTGSCNSSVPYDPDWYYTRLGPVRPRSVLHAAWPSWPHMTPIGITWGMVPYDPDWYYMGLGPVQPGLIIGINMCKLSHLSAETVLTLSHLFAETVLGASHLLVETVFSASHLFAETVFSASPLFAETY
ncbi:hypothetical protein BS47DRAFT_1370156, partial [Hydnum rufescens UP504]